MAQMPVATLRIWEQRHQAVRPATAPSGHRLYRPADVQRVLLLRRLTEQGHAIGSIAALDHDQLQRLAGSAAALGAAWSAPPALPVPSAAPGRSSVAAATTAEPEPRPAPQRLVVVGTALALRLQRAALLRAGGPPARVLAVFESLDEAAAAAPSARRTEWLIWHAPELQAEAPAAWKAALDSALKASRARRVAVFYRFASAAAVRALSQTGALVLREPADDAALAAWLHGLPAASARGAPLLAEGQLDRQDERRDERKGAPAMTEGAVAPRRYDDAVLTAVAALPPQLACECPRHIAELLMQLASFEAYSAGCRNRSAEDAQLHGYLHQVAGTARALFESALERVARHEGLALG